MWLECRIGLVFFHLPIFSYTAAFAGRRYFWMAAARVISVARSVCPPRSVLFLTVVAASLESPIASFSLPERLSVQRDFTGIKRRRKELNHKQVRSGLAGCSRRLLERPLWVRTAGTCRLSHHHPPPLLLELISLDFLDQPLSSFLRYCQALAEPFPWHHMDEWIH